MLNRAAVRVLAVMLAVVVAAAGVSAQSKAKKKKKKGKDAPVPAATGGAQVVTARPFGEMLGTMPYNASGIVPIADGRFLVCENRTQDAVFELHLDAQGNKAGPLVRREMPLPAGSTVGDLEAMTLIETGGKRFVVATSSFNQVSQKRAAAGGASYTTGLLRISVGDAGTVVVEDLPGFRDWIVSKYPELKASAAMRPDAGGLNIEGLAWDPGRGALLFGVRTPLVNGQPVLLPVRLRDPAGPWEAASFEAMPAIHLKTDTAGLGVRGLDYDGTNKRFLLTMGNAISGTKIAFRIYVWDGIDGTTVRLLSGLTFDPRMKVEGITHGTIGNRGAVVLVDDGGGYAVIWDDDPRLK